MTNRRLSDISDHDVSRNPEKNAPFGQWTNREQEKALPAQPSSILMSGIRLTSGVTSQKTETLER